VKTAYAGAVAALAAGLLSGAAMRPDLTADDRPAGPQIFAEASPARPTGPFDDSPTWARYGGKVPDYVLGTDYVKLAGQAAALPAATPIQVSYAGPPPSDDMPPLRLEDLTSAAAADPAAEPADIDPEAPPEAAGDTRPAR
jgi:hypothetical protein